MLHVNQSTANCPIETFISEPTTIVSVTDGDMSGSQTQVIPKDDMIDINEFLQNLPAHLSQLACQAAGHPFNQEKNTLGLLKHADGYVLKCAESKKKTAELIFYREIQNGCYRKLAPLLPKFHGTINIPFRNKSIQFMVLEDLARGFDKPCVLDLKIGERTWDPDATIEKINHEKEKYKECKEHYGFCIPGCQIFHPINSKVEKFDRDYCRSLRPDEVIREIERFVYTTKNSQATAVLLKRIILELEPVWEWASTQTELRLYASSILIMYDSQALLDMVSYIEEERAENRPTFVRVKMIDFTHVYKAPVAEGVDTNYLRGLNSLMNILQKLLLKHSTST